MLRLFVNQATTSTSLERLTSTASVIAQIGAVTYINQRFGAEESKPNQTAASTASSYPNSSPPLNNDKSAPLEPKSNYKRKC